MPNDHGMQRLREEYGDQEECGPPYPFSDQEKALVSAVILGSALADASTQPQEGA